MREDHEYSMRRKLRRVWYDTTVFAPIIEMLVIAYRAFKNRKK